jgi:hypothetical protein
VSEVCKWILLDLVVILPHYGDGTNDAKDDGAPVGQNGNASRKEGGLYKGIKGRNKMSSSHGRDKSREDGGLARTETLGKRD